MKFESVRCDECNRIQDGANHWLKMAVRMVNDAVVLVALGDVTERIGLYRDAELADAKCETEIHDLCGQGCAVKHLAKLLGWNVPSQSEAALSWNSAVEAFERRPD